MVSHDIREPTRIRPIVAPELAEDFTQGLFRLFSYYCLCIPAYSKGRWISPRKVGLLNTVAWLSFLKDTFENCITAFPGLAFERNSRDSWWWRNRQSIMDDFCWGLSAREAVSAEVLNTVVARDRQLPTDDNIVPSNDSPEGRRRYRFYSRHMA